MPFDRYILKSIEQNDPALQQIHLRGFITDEDIGVLVETVQRGHNTNLKTIWIYDSLISDQGAVLLAKLENVENLDLHANQIGDEGVMAIAHMPRLKHLNLAGNHISDRGAEVLTGNQTITSLILLANADITEVGIKCFLVNRTLTELVFDEEKFALPLVADIKQQIAANGDHGITQKVSFGSSAFSMWHTIPASMHDIVVVFHRALMADARTRKILDDPNFWKMVSDPQNAFAFFEKLRRLCSAEVASMHPENK